MSEFEAAGHSDHVEQHVLRTAEREGIPFGNPRFLPKTHRALALAEMARDRGSLAHMTMHHAIFNAYFAQGRDIGDREVLLEIAAEHGLGRDEVLHSWTEGTYDERLHRFRHLAIQLGITSTPAALVCNELLIGSRPYKVISDAVRACLVTPDEAEDEVTSDGEEPVAAGAVGEGEASE